jgi:hypothetical protein
VITGDPIIVETAARRYVGRQSDTRSQRHVDDEPLNLAAADALKMVGERSDVPAVDVGPARRECGKGLVNKRSEIPPSHHPPLAERFAPPPPEPVDPTPAEAMAHRLKTPDGKKLYALRKQTPEPVFGIIKSVLGFRQFCSAASKISATNGAS